LKQDWLRYLTPCSTCGHYKGELIQFIRMLIFVDVVILMLVYVDSHICFISRFGYFLQCDIVEKFYICVYVCVSCVYMYVPCVYVYVYMSVHVCPHCDITWRYYICVWVYVYHVCTCVYCVCVFVYTMLYRRKFYLICVVYGWSQLVTTNIKLSQVCFILFMYIRCYGYQSIWKITEILHFIKNPFIIMYFTHSSLKTKTIALCTFL